MITWTHFVALGLTLSACVDEVGPDHLLDCGGTDADEPCCAEREGLASLCLLGDADGTPISTLGSFSQWAWFDNDGQGPRPVFVAEDGTEYAVSIITDEPGLAALPDLEALGPVLVAQHGDCGADGPANQILEVWATDSQQLLFACGNRAGQVGAWSIATGFSPTECAAREGSACTEYDHAVTVNVEHEDETWTLWQGQDLTTDGMTLHVGAAWVGSGAYTCDDGADRWLSWFLAPE